MTFNGIKFGEDSCYNNGLWDERRVVFFCEHYFLLPDGMNPKDGYHVLMVGFGPHVCRASLKFAGQYHDLKELTRAMLMMCGSDELRHEYGPYAHFNEYVEETGRMMGRRFMTSYA